MKELEAHQPDFRPKATETINEMVEMIEGLVEKGAAYPAKTEFGTDIYFSVEKFEEYGKLSKRKLDDMIAGVRIDTAESKKHPGDFALWKASKPGEPKWPSPWGDGRPGWHIECSAMIHGLFKDKLDIHMGGIDLVFPHHENEIAQSECLTQTPLATYWVHNGLIEMGSEKMSKSIGNIIRTRDFLENYGTETLRLMVFQQHYRSPMDLSMESIIRAEALIDRLYLCKEKVSTNLKASGDEQVSDELNGLQTKIKDALLDDFNSAKALGFILGAARTCFKTNSPAFWKKWGETSIPVLNDIFGLTKGEPSQSRVLNKERKIKRSGITQKRADEIETKLKDRERFRAEKNYAESDRLRDELQKEGIQVMDGADGATWTVQE